MLVESAIAFTLITAATLLIYMLGRRAAPKPVQSASQLTGYACGEKVTYSKLKMNVSFYKYLIYFVVLDSSVLLVAFASFMANVNIPMIVLYLSMILGASLILFEGGKDQ
jgi:NADH:ubiquinone oxidoreductase subunit 3 (subunit A)